MAAPKLGAVTSFQRKQPSRTTQIRGTRTSLQASLLLTSTGVASLDNLMGGGLAVGSLFIIEEDAFATYSSLLLKYFVSEGLANGHSVFLTPTVQHTVEQLLERLPAPATREPASAVTLPPPGTTVLPTNADEELKIAWRYKSIASVSEAGKSATYSHNYDLSKAVDPEVIARADVVKYSPLNVLSTPTDELGGSPADAMSSLSPKYLRLARAIQEAVAARHLGDLASLTSDAAVMRVVLPSLGSSLWIESDRQATPSASVSSDTALLRFLYCLKAIMRASLCVGYVTVPAYVLKDLSLERNITYLADSVVRLEAFVDSPAGQKMASSGAFDAYKGFVKVLKYPRINTLSAVIPSDQDYVFGVSRKAFSIEKFHLPPDFSDTVSRSSSSVASSGGTFSCSSAGGDARDAHSSGPLDF